jgi:hypothetical protein
VIASQRAALSASVGESRQEKRPVTAWAWSGNGCGHLRYESHAARTADLEALRSLNGAWLTARYEWQSAVAVWDRLHAARDVADLRDRTVRARQASCPASRPRHGHRTMAGARQRGHACTNTSGKPMRVKTKLAYVQATVEQTQGHSNQPA